MRLKIYILKNIMYEQELKLDDLHRLSGVSKATLSAVRNGKTCAYDTAVKIANGLNVDVEELIIKEETE